MSHLFSLTGTLSGGIARLIGRRIELRLDHKRLEKEISDIVLLEGALPKEISREVVGDIEESGVWEPDAARRLIKHQAKERGANCIIHYREVSAAEPGHITCHGAAFRVPEKHLPGLKKIAFGTSGDSGILSAWMRKLGMRKRKAAPE